MLMLLVLNALPVLVPAYLSVLESARSASAARSSTASLGFLRNFFGPNVCSNDSTWSSFTFPSLSVSFSNDIGNFDAFKTTLKGSSTLLDISSRNSWSLFCVKTRVFPNQRRSGWMRTIGTFGAAFIFASFGFERYMLSRFIVAFDLMWVWFLPLTRSGFVLALPRLNALVLLPLDFATCALWEALFFVALLAACPVFAIAAPA